MMDVSLTEILIAREERVRLQQSYLQKYGCPLICFTMNIAGPVKNTPLIRRGFQVGLDAIAQSLPENLIRDQFVEEIKTGSTAIFAVQMDAKELKIICTKIEDTMPLGRLFDMDVLDTTGQKLERTNQRGCLICGAPGRQCAAGRLHPVDELQSTTNRILRNYFAEFDRERIASLAVQCLIDEVNTTPKPGLVDLRNNGSHKDMTVRHFIASANALKPYFCECVKIGQSTADQSPNKTFEKLQHAGLAAEKAMYHATGGVNTHKGAIYTLGILCGSLGRLWRADFPIAEIESILRECGNMVHQSVCAYRNNLDTNVAVYWKHGLGGVRMEVADGLPSVRKIALPCYKKALEDGCTRNDAGVLTLLHLIAHVEDTNLFHRGGMDGLRWASQSAKELLNHAPITHDKIEQLDDAFIARNLSPGGCADLLAVTYFLHALQ